MSETHIFLKYDGHSDALKKHRIEAKQLGETLIELADLIYDANTTLNGVDSFVDVQAQAGFIEGSFGLELIIDQGSVEGVIEVAKYLGLGVTAVAGNLLSILKNKGRKEPDLSTVVIDERSGTATIMLDDEQVPTTPEVIELLKSRMIRKRVANIVNKPLKDPGIDMFKVMDSADDQNEVISIDKITSEMFKEPPRVKSETVEELETVAAIEFLTSNKESGSSGWRMRYLGRDVSVKVQDEVFLNAIKKEDEPSIYGLKYSVDLFYRKTQSASGSRDNYIITKVRSRVRE